MILQVNADEVSEEVQGYWKTAYRVCRIFNGPDVRGPLRCAHSLKTKLEKFKVNLPLIAAICNPGLKQRHWEQMSEQIGINIVPKPENTLSDFLQLGLDKHLEILSSISAQGNSPLFYEIFLRKGLD